MKTLTKTVESIEGVQITVYPSQVSWDISDYECSREYKLCLRAEGSYQDCTVPISEEFYKELMKRKLSNTKLQLEIKFID